MLSAGVLEVPWVLDVDVTVKPLYGKQEGAARGYNPAKLGRPSHAYHSFWVSHLRLCLDVQVRPGNETAGSFGLGSVINWLARRPTGELPEFVRGDIGYGTQTWMQEFEKLKADSINHFLDYLTKDLRVSASTQCFSLSLSRGL